MVTGIAFGFGCGVVTVFVIFWVGVWWDARQQRRFKRLAPAQRREQIARAWRRNGA